MGSYTITTTDAQEAALDWCLIQQGGTDKAVLVQSLADDRLAGLNSQYEAAQAQDPERIRAAIAAATPERLVALAADLGAATLARVVGVLNAPDTGTV